MTALPPIKTFLKQTYVRESPEKFYLTQNNALTLKLEVFPSRVKFGLESESAKLKRQYHGLNKGAGTYGSRGQVQEFSKKSRRRFNEKLHDLQTIGVQANYLITLTYPAEIESLKLDGKKIKKQHQTFRKRLLRKFKKLGLPFHVVWWLEFQKRGAPHFHYFLCDIQINRRTLKELQLWLKSAWAEIVKHPNQIEYQKHFNAGTRFEWTKNKSFAYAMAYMSKPEQKQVPEGFENVGRFWGFWNITLPLPITYTVRVQDEIVSALKDMALLKLEKKSFRHAQRIYKGLCDSFYELYKSFTSTLYGEDSVYAMLEIAEIMDINNQKIPKQKCLDIANKVVQRYFAKDRDWERWLTLDKPVLVGQMEL